MEDKQIKGHIVVLPYPSQGHINPLLQFAKRLASKGVKATLATTRYTLHFISALTSGSNRLGRLRRRRFFSTAWDLRGCFFTNSATVCNIFAHVQHGLLVLPLDRETMPLVLPGLPPLNSRDLPNFLRFPDSYPAYLAMKLSQYSNLNEADWEARGVSEIWPAKLIGPMVPSAYLDERIKGDRGYGSSLWKPLSDECMEWLETKPSNSVVYVSFGSMVSLSEEQIKEIAWSLKESNMYFLWVVRDTEQRKLTQWFIEYSGREKGKVVTWCNQLEMLAHRTVGCFVTHCGWNLLRKTAIG
ncbi:protein NLRC3-like [Hibiscus syriacus]|uniref:Protein NLRC3-like n=1 Tax=Hibiscus syriacus TaxID=106335 RepID=A0A6A2WKU6_HIBSY|nr:protein NLRC3-like [Hibiscus syriacus]